VFKEIAMVKWSLVFTKDARKDAKKIQAAGLRVRVDELFAVLCVNPFQNPPAYERLVGDLAGLYSRRITIKHRLVYQVYKIERIVKILRMWTHY
jgi:Txe/YoeB family toxin of toxin-antitoxin system